MFSPSSWFHRPDQSVARQLAEQYGDEVASDVLLRSRNKIASLSGGTAPSSPLPQSFSQPLPPQPQARATGVDPRGGDGYARPPMGYGSPAPSSYPFSGPPAAVSSASPDGNRPGSGYATYGSSAYQMNMLSRGPNEQGEYNDGRRV